MTYAVLIPCYNEAENLPRCLQSINAAKQSRDIFVRVIDNRSPDDSVKVARQFGADVLVAPERLSIAALRNLGTEEIDADIFVFLDADMEVPDDWFEHLDKAFSSGAADALGFVETIPTVAPWYATAWSLRTLARRDKVRPADFLPGRNIAVRKHFFRAIGGFSSELITSEDKDFVIRLKAAGANVLSAPPIGLYHWGFEGSLSEWARKEFWRQRSHMTLMRRNGISLRLLRFPMLALFHIVALAFLLLALVLREPILITPWLLSWLPTIGLVLFKPVSRSRPLLCIQLLLLYHVRFMIAGAAVAYEFVTMNWNEAHASS